MVLGLVDGLGAGWILIWGGNPIIAAMVAALILMGCLFLLKLPPFVTIPSGFALAALTMSTVNELMAMVILVAGFIVGMFFLKIWKGG